MISFSLFNIPVRVLPWFWITLALIGGGLHADTRQELLHLALFIIAGFISIIVHELGHGLTAKHFGKRVEIVLQAFGGYAAYSGGAPLSRKKTFMITAAGPLIQIALGGLIFLLVQVVPHMNGNATYFLRVLIAISFIWALLNLLPILPLDGGRLVESALGPARIKTTLIVSCATGIVVCLLSFTYFYQPFLGVFVGMFAYQSFKALQNPTLH